jgi:hypothetical protein
MWKNRNTWMSTPFTIKSSGNVGIGISAPNAKLDVNNSIQISGSHASNNGVFANLNFYNNYTNSNSVLARIQGVRGDDDFHKGNLAFTVKNGTDLVEAIRIKGNGNIGVGTSMPKAKLQVNEIRPILFRSNGNKGVYGSEIGFNSMLNTNVVPNKFIKLGSTKQKGGAVQVVDHWGNMSFQMFDGNTLGEKIIDHKPQVFFKNTGNVGIGTSTTGSHRLAVEGSIGAREIKVEATGWSDFVFEENYQLPTLKEVENHIKEKGHLQDIPSAEKVKKDGFFLGEMDAKLLQKIEELTLYTIDQEKKLEAQDLKINKQDVEIRELKALNKMFIDLQNRLKRLESKN